MTKVYSSTGEVGVDTVVSTPVVTAPVPNCEAVDLPDGSVIITVHVDPQVIKRHRLRAGGMDINRYMWENVLHRALVDSVY